MDRKFTMYDGGALQFVDPRTPSPVSFAHVADLHLPPDPPDLWPKRYRRAIEWWDIEQKRPNAMLPGMLDEIQAQGVDFVFFGGDILDYYHPETADRVVRLCQERGLEAHFQIGNHDWETEHIRYVTNDLEPQVRAERSAKVAQHWNMPGLYYSFDKAGVRFIALDTPYERSQGVWAGLFDDAQADRLGGQLDCDQPIVVFHHVPFNTPSLEPHVRAFWQGSLACVAENDKGLRVKHAIENCPNILGTFVGHAHLRSEDPIGGTWQFMAEAGIHRWWRYVKISNTDPPKSLRVPDTARTWMAHDE